MRCNLLRPAKNPTDFYEEPKVRAISSEFRASAEARIAELEKVIERKVAEEVRKRVQQKSP
jgi:hypothetical protein